VMSMWNSMPMPRASRSNVVNVGSCSPDLRITRVLRGHDELAGIVWYQRFFGRLSSGNSVLSPPISF
jgi:hypothetical protein